jgi:hypothetical protein
MQIYYILIISIDSYMLRPPIVAIVREVFYEGILYKPLNNFTVQSDQQKQQQNICLDSVTYTTYEHAVQYK